MHFEVQNVIQRFELHIIDFQLTRARCFEEALFFDTFPTLSAERERLGVCLGWLHVLQHRCSGTAAMLRGDRWREGTRMDGASGLGVHQINSWCKGIMTQAKTHLKYTQYHKVIM